jgi:hypothetical protein
MSLVGTWVTPDTKLHILDLSGFIYLILDLVRDHFPESPVTKSAERPKKPIIENWCPLGSNIYGLDIEHSSDGFTSQTLGHRSTSEVMWFSREELHQNVHDD